MGALDKLMFWKKKDDFSSFNSSSFGSQANDPLGSTPLHENLGLESDPFGQDSMATQQFNQNQMQTQTPGAPAPPSDFNNPSTNDARNVNGFEKQRNLQNNQMSNRDIELLSSKLDTIKAYLQSLDARVASIERIAKQEEQAQKQEQNHNLW